MSWDVRSLKNPVPFHVMKAANMQGSVPGKYALFAAVYGIRRYYHVLVLFDCDYLAFFHLKILKNGTPFHSIVFFGIRQLVGTGTLYYGTRKHDLTEKWRTKIHLGPGVTIKKKLLQTLKN